jgi:hypothetical protein
MYSSKPEIGISRSSGRADRKIISTGRFCVQIRLAVAIAKNRLRESMYRF